MTPDQIEEAAIEAAKAALKKWCTEEWWDKSPQRLVPLKVEWDAFARAAIDAYEAEMWRPIEEAPKDGTSVFVIVPGESLYPTAAHYHSREYFEKEYGDPEYMEEGWRWSFGYPSDFHEELIEPTHFRPLPKPPEAK